MRRLLIDHARKHLGPKQGGGRTISLEGMALVSPERASELVALDEALTSLAKLDQAKEYSSGTTLLWGIKCGRDSRSVGRFR
jgi:hypothetical protein